MLPVGEVLQRVMSAYSRGVQSDDSHLTYRHSYSASVGVRASLIKETSNKKQILSQACYQTLPCVELIPAPIHECACIPSIGCSVFKTKYPLPEAIFAIKGSLIQSVTSLNGGIIYPEITWNAMKYRKGNKYTANNPYYILRDGHMLLPVKNSVKVISITGAWADPIEAALYPSMCRPECQSNDCIECKSMLDFDFCMDESMMDTLVKLCSEELIKEFSQGVEDATNNSRDNVIEQSK